MIPNSQKILIIDDNEVDRTALSLMFRRSGYQIESLGSAVGCMEVIQSKNPQVVLLDVLMPDMNGNDALIEIRKVYSELDLPVMMVTSKTDDADVIEALKNGANDYITKHTQFDVALRRVQTQLQFSLLLKNARTISELMAAHAAIVTYNHEINNPLAAALLNVQLIKEEKTFDHEKFDAIEGSILRIQRLLKNLEGILTKEGLTYDQYSKFQKMFKVDSN